MLIVHVKSYVTFFFSRLKEQKNLNLFFAVMFGLSNSAVQRLYKTWEVSVYTVTDLFLLESTLQILPWMAKKSFR